MTTKKSATPKTTIMSALVDELCPTLDEALAAYEASGSTEDFNTWNAKWASDYMDSKISKRLETPAPAETSKPATKKKTSKAEHAANPDHIPTVPAEIMEVQTSLVPANDQIFTTKVDLLHQATDRIRGEVDAIAKSFCKIGFNLWEIKHENLFESDGYRNISEYGEHVLGFKKSSTANYIAICERFSVRIDGKPTAQLMEGFSNFSYGQLSVMLSLPESKIKDVTPDMTVNAVRALKKDGEPEESGDTKTSDMPDPPVKIFSRTLTAGTIDIAIKLLQDNLGKEISIYVE